MGQVIDEAGIQFRMLNRDQGSGDALPRAQADKKAYQFAMKLRVEEQANLALRQEMVEGLRDRGEGRECAGVRGARATPSIGPRAVILTTGTFLKALMHTGEAKTAGGRAGEGTTNGLCAEPRPQLRLPAGPLQDRHALPANGRTIDFAELQFQPGDADPQPFSASSTEQITQPQIPCHITQTNERSTT